MSQSTFFTRCRASQREYVRYRMAENRQAMREKNQAKYAALENQPKTVFLTTKRMNPKGTP